MSPKISLTSLLWKDDVTAALVYVRFDAVQSESPEDTVTITDHPVEQGANVVDHAREEPTRLSIEGLVSTIATEGTFETIPLSVPVMAPSPPQVITLDPPKPPLPLSPGGLIRSAVTGIGDAIFGGPNMDAQFAGEPQPVIQKVNVQVRTPKDHKQFVTTGRGAPGKIKTRINDVYDALLRAQSQRALVQVSTRDRDYADMLIERVAKPRSVGDGRSAKFQVDLRRIRVVGSVVVAAPKPTEERGKPSVNRGAQAAVKLEGPEGEKRKKTFTKVLIETVGPERFAKVLFGL